MSVLSPTTFAGVTPPATPLRRHFWPAVAATIAAAAISLTGIAVAPAAIAGPAPAAGTTTTVTASPVGRVTVGTTLTLHIRVTTTPAPTPTPTPTPPPAASPAQARTTTGTPTGSVTVNGDGLPAAGVTANLVQGAAIVPVKTATAGLHTYQVTFTPADTAFTSSRGQVAVTVQALPTNIKLTTSPANRVNIGSAVTLRAVVSVNAAGTVTFTDNGKALKNVVVSRQVATLKVTPTRGKHAYGARFSPKNPLVYGPATAAIVTVAATSPPATIPLVAGASGALVVLAQQRLNWSGIIVRVTGTFDAATVSAVKRLQGKFFYPETGIINAHTMALLSKLSVKSLPRACTNVGVALCIDKTRKILQFVVHGKIEYSVDARFGNVAEGLATRDGLFTIERKTGRHHLSTEFKTDMPWAMFFSGGQAVHYSKYFAAVGYNGHSHGCVNIRDYDAISAIYHHAPLGTTVFIYSS